MIWHSSKFTAPALFVLLLDQAIKFLAVNKIIGLEFSKNSGALFGVQLNVNFIFVFFAVFLFVATIGFKQTKLLKSGAIALVAFYSMLGGIVIIYLIYFLSISRIWQFASAR